MLNSFFILLLSLVVKVRAFGPQTARSLRRFPSSCVPPPEKGARGSVVTCHAVSVSGMWNAGLSYGKGPFRFYSGFDEWMGPFPDEDRDAYPEMFALPPGVFEVALRKPLGIVFEESEPGRGVFVSDLVEGGNAETDGTVQRGGVLIALTAVKVIGAKWERRLIPAEKLDFDTVVGAIGSNEEKWGCTDVVLQFKRPGEVDDDKVKSHLELFEPPLDSPWRR